jgi:hypothetical protein
MFAVLGVRVSLVVGTLTGPLGRLSAARLAVVPAAAGSGANLPPAVYQHEADLCRERRVVGAEVGEEAVSRSTVPWWLRSSLDLQVPVFLTWWGGADEQVSGHRRRGIWPAQPVRIRWRRMLAACPAVSAAGGTTLAGQPQGRNPSRIGSHNGHALGIPPACRGLDHPIQRHVLHHNQCAHDGPPVQGDIGMKPGVAHNRRSGSAPATAKEPDRWRMCTKSATLNIANGSRATIEVMTRRKAPLLVSAVVAIVGRFIFIASALLF